MIPSQPKPPSVAENGRLSVPAGKENIWNVPNFLTLCRVIFAMAAIYLIFAAFNIIYIVALFIAGMITDALDGQIARRLKMTTEFGRKFDVAADRFLMLGVALALTIKLDLDGGHIFQIIIMLTREITALPFAVFSVLTKQTFPKVKFIGKITTVAQAITFPMIILSIFYPFWGFSFYFALATGALGLVSGCVYIIDVLKLDKSRI